MAKAIFEVTNKHEDNLPPMESDDGYQLHFTEGGVLKGGYSCISEAPMPHTLTVQIEASEAVLDLIAEDVRYFYLGDVDDGEEA